MRMYDLILKKRDGGCLTTAEINYMIEGYTNGQIPDYQMSAMMMAVYFNGMNDQETLDLTTAMVNSGDILDLSAIHGIKADKHSTGGVGDKTSLVLGPMAAALGIPVAKMSGRGLGHTGGTIDKLECFPGFSVDLSKEAFIRQVNEIKLAIAGQTGELAPADKKLYALRDVTGTVENLSLIAGSIMSKKLAAGADVIVLDVKTGSGAFMKTEEDSFALAKEMVKIGCGAGKRTTALVTDMDQPLGFAVGNALEVKEAIDTLNGGGSDDVRELCIELGAYMAVETGTCKDLDEAREKLAEVIENKAALHKLAEFVEAQGGDAAAVYDPALLPQAPFTKVVKTDQQGYISGINTQEVGMVSLVLGGGRETKDSVIDLSVGVVLNKKTGDYVKNKEVLAILHGSSKKTLDQAEERLRASYTFSNEPAAKKKLIKGVVPSYIN